jgi:hypothetical protein
VEYIHTSKVLADGRTKVFEGKEFISFHNNLVGVKTEKDNQWRLEFMHPVPVALFCLIPFHVPIWDKTQRGSF